MSVSRVAVSLGDLHSRFMFCQKLFRSRLSGGGKGSTEAGNRGRVRFRLWRNGCPLAQESFSAPVWIRALDLITFGLKIDWINCFVRPGGDIVKLAPIGIGNNIRIS